MPRPKTRKLSKKEAKYRVKQQELRQREPLAPIVQVAPVKVIEVPQVITVRNFAEISGIGVAKVIETLLKNGVKATINESIDFDTASIIAQDFNLELKPSGIQKKATTGTSKTLVPRPPVVTVMGHVDHGKTKLLDAIRETNLVEKESGGITQHIGAYQVKVKSKEGDRLITFLDTPGHEAFSSLRAHGANITDIVVLVVAADDGVKPQTLEALSHARAANVPIIVAINKVDLPEADPQKVRRQLAEINLLPEDWGGKTPVVEVSAKQKRGLAQLEEVILLVTDLNPPMTDSRGLACGAVVEAHIDRGSGPTVTLLVTQGQLQVGDLISAGRAWGKIRALKDWQANHLKKAVAGMPVVVTGLKSLPEFGDTFNQAATELEARELTASYAKPSLIRKLLEPQADVKTLNLVIKADASASLQAIVAMVSEMRLGEVANQIVSSGIGSVSETDVKTAAAANATILAFRVPAGADVKKIAQLQRVKILSFEVIYQLGDAVKAMLKDMVEPRVVKKPIGKLQVVKVFMQARAIALVGGKVIQGEIKAGDYCEVWRQDQIIGEGKITSIQIGAKPVDKVGKGTQGGLKIAKSGQLGYKIKQDDHIVAYVIEKVSSD